MKQIYLKLFGGCSMALATITASMAQVGFLDGNDLHRMCEQRSQTTIGYVMGVTDAAEMYHSIGILEKRYCLRPNMSSGQVTDIICRFLDENPATRDLDASLLIAAHLAETYPCQ